MAVERIVMVWTLGLMCWTQGAKVNIARGKPASTSLGHNTSWIPDKAVDGDNNIKGGERTCFSGAGSPSDWTVDLEQEYQLYAIRVYLLNTYEYRIADSFIYLDKNLSRICYTFPSVNGNNPTDVTCNRTGRYVTIRNPGDGGGDPQADNLGICEVKIYGCTAGTYGIHCTDSCHCASPPCDRWTGVCSGDCADGYTGNKCDKTCSNTTYGVNCEKKCADRKCITSIASCDRVTGSCDTGCLPGWMGTDCIKVCGNQYYGRKCSSSCAGRNCDGNSTCNHVTGSCDKGCTAGWKGSDCKQACDLEHYGRGCTLTCATRHCEGNSTCTASTGQCDLGCETGWTGSDCTACDRKHYGLSCTRVCSSRHCVAVSACSPSTGQCEGGCQTGWTGIDCTETALGLDQTSVIVASVTAVVVVILVFVIIGVMIWRRRKRREMWMKQDSEHTYYNVVSESAKAKNKGSVVSPGDSLPVGSYDKLDGISRDTGSKYTKLDLDKRESVGVATTMSDITTCDDYEPVSGMTYENMTPSRDREDDSTVFQRTDTYENVKRNGTNH